MKLNNEMKTGIIVAVATAVAVMFWVKTTDFSASNYKLKTYFTYADGIKVDSIVKLAGIEVGRVEKFDFSYDGDTRVEVMLTISSKAKIREDSIAFISTSGMIGDAYIGITPGSASKPFVKDGATLVSEDPIEMRKLMKKAESIAENLDKTLTEIRELAGGVNGVVKDNRPRVDNIVVNLESTAKNFNEFSQDIKAHPWKLLMKK
jgi:phospholipid/cholesterol/gamma-HCH transport system substrate-binding protein